MTTSKKSILFFVISLSVLAAFLSNVPATQGSSEPTGNAIDNGSQQDTVILDVLERAQLEHFRTRSSEIDRLLAEFPIRELNITCQPDSGFGAQLPGNCTAIKVKAKLGYTGTLADYLIDFEAFAQSLGKKEIDFNDIDADTVLHIIRDAETQAFVKNYIAQNQIQNAQVSLRKPESWEESPFALIYEVRYANAQNYLILRYGDKKLIEYSTDLFDGFQFPHREKLVTSDLFHAFEIVTDRPAPSYVRCGTGPLKLHLCAPHIEEVVSYDYCQIQITLGLNGRFQDYFQLFDYDRVIPKSASFEVIEKIKDKTYITRILDDSLVRSYIQKYQQGSLETRPEKTYEKDKFFLYATSGQGVWSEEADDNDLSLKLNCSDKPQTIQKVISQSESIIQWRDEITPWILLFLYAIFVPLATGWLFHRRFVLSWLWLITWGILGVSSSIIWVVYNMGDLGDVTVLGPAVGFLYSLVIVTFGFPASVIGSRIKSLRFMQEVMNRCARKERAALVLIVYAASILPALVAGKVFSFFKIWFLPPQIAILLGLQCMSIVISVLIIRRLYAAAKQREPRPFVLRKKDYIVYSLILIVAICLFLYTLVSYLGVFRRNLTL